MCEPTTMAIMSAMSSAVSFMQQRAAARAANAAQAENMATTTQNAREGAMTMAGQRATQLTQQQEASTQKQQKIADQSAEYIAANTAAKDSVAGNALIALMQEGWAKKGQADAAVTRQKEFALSGYYAGSDIDSLKARARIQAAWKPPVAMPSPLGLVINMAVAGMSAYAQATAAGLGDTAKAAAVTGTGTDLTMWTGGAPAWDTWANQGLIINQGGTAMPNLYLA